MKLPSTKEERKRLLLNILAIAGVVILIVIVVLGLFRMATLSKPWLSSLLSKSTGLIQRTTPPATDDKSPASAVSTSVPPPSPAQKSTAGSGAPKAPDLSVRILSVGIIDRISGNIIPREPTSANDLVAVRFLISNNGNAHTGPWYFVAQLPTMTPNNIYTSPIQASLAPGASIENMLRFTYAIPAGNFTVSVDPQNQVGESNEGNNTASIAI